MEQITNVFQRTYTILRCQVNLDLVCLTSSDILSCKIIFVNFLETMCATSTLVLLLNFPIPAFEFFYILVFDFLTFDLAY